MNISESAYPLHGKDIGNEIARSDRHLQPQHVLSVGKSNPEFASRVYIPLLSRKPIMPKPASIAVHTHPPSSRSYIRLRAEKMSSLFTLALPVTPNSDAFAPGIDMSVPFVQKKFQLRSVDEVATIYDFRKRPQALRVTNILVGKADAVGIIGKEWLFKLSESAQLLGDEF